ncbi:MAG: PQQ-binding-like beta-propeller repeat protein [candidate division KSB1 bacterium]|nr:PQQ-binding-like beta-propeller repeat protein [candidate division KSB1 bacterium]MDZ7304489.1 PQQ-binding-like beta-propeller repeat protein [candidate division KSB1 bacterium]MDZ7312996.1 PQQ-binding-like beta-propeller repeat protein [candidate division KSB1 bacterium]
MSPKGAAKKILLTAALALAFVGMGCSGFNLEWRVYNGEPTACLAGVSPERRSYLPSTLDVPLQEIARVKLSSAVSQHLCANRDFLLVPTLDGRLSAIDLKLFKVITRKKLPRASAGTIAVTRQTLVIAMRLGEATLLCYDLLEGRKLWEVDAGDIASEPLLADSLVYVAALYKHVDAYRLQDGTRRWQFRTEAQFHASPALSQGILVVASNDGKVYGLQALSGKKLWEFDCKEPVLATPAIHRNIVFIGTAGENVLVLKLQDGALLWKNKIGAKVMHAPAANDSLVIWGSNDGRVRAFDIENGTLRWVFRAGSVIGTSPLVADNLVFVGSLDHNLYALELRSGAVAWQQQLEGRVRTDPIVVGERLIVASEDRVVYIFGKATAAATQ